jgi:hypothetical protein
MTVHAAGHLAPASRLKGAAMRWTRPDGLPELSAEQRQKLLALLRQELSDSYQAAVAAGADPAELAKELDERRHALAADIYNANGDATATDSDSNLAAGSTRPAARSKSGRTGQPSLHAVADDVQDRPDDPAEL